MSSPSQTTMSHTLRDFIRSLSNPLHEEASSNPWSHDPGLPLELRRQGGGMSARPARGPRASALVGSALALAWVLRAERLRAADDALAPVLTRRDSPHTHLAQNSRGTSLAARSAGASPTPPPSSSEGRCARPACPAQTHAPASNPSSPRSHLPRISPLLPTELPERQGEGAVPHLHLPEPGRRRLHHGQKVLAHCAPPPASGRTSHGAPRPGARTQRPTAPLSARPGGRRGRLTAPLPHRARRPSGPPRDERPACRAPAPLRHR